VKIFRSAPAPDTEALLDALETVLLRCRAGQTLGEALSDMPSLTLDTQLAREWAGLRDGILEGRLPAGDSVEAWARQLRAQSRLRRLVALRTRNPRTQARALSALIVLFFLASRFLFPRELQASWILLLAAGALASAGMLWLRHELRAFERRLWFAEWIGFLSRAAAGLAWGRTFGSAWIEEERALPVTSWPRPVREATRTLAEALRTYEPATAEAFRAPARASPELRRTLEQIKLLHTLHFEATPLRPALESFVRHGLASFETKLSEEAERLAFRALIPLFTCFAPAMLMLLFAPLLTLLGSA
jgi:hypothetical protein